MTETLHERLGLAKPKEYKVKKNGIEGVDPTLLYGVELEIEGLERDEDTRSARAVAGMQYHKDGSLRNNGGEFVTSPMNYSALTDTLGRFFSANEYNEDNYSERCSVHVHANCQDLTLDQIRLVICLYQILEKVLFNYVKADRENNIFCVPLGESVIASRIMLSSEALLNNANRKWRKYTALNLLPLYSQGTMEFRHMAGTCDQRYILQWCEIIGSLFKYARDHKFEEVVNTLMDLNTSSAYATFMQDIFRGDLYEVLAVGPYRDFLEDGVINMKVMLASPKEEGIKDHPMFYDEDVPPVPNLRAGGGWVINANAAGQAPDQPAPVEQPYTDEEINRLHLEIHRRTRAGERGLDHRTYRMWLDNNPAPIPEPIRPEPLRAAMPQALGGDLDRMLQRARERVDQQNALARQVRVDGVRRR